MLSRLSQPAGRHRFAARAVSGLAVLVFVSGCGTPFSAVGSAAGGGGAGGGGDGPSAGDGGTPDSGGTSGGAGGGATSGMGGTAGGAGTAGAAATSCDCAAGNYCREGTTKCRSCADFANLSFGAPEKLSTLSQGNERFPRAADTGSALFYTEGTIDQTELRYTESPASGIGTSISSSMRVESGALLAPGFYQQNLFFDRKTNGKRRIMMAAWLGKSVTAATLAPAPINAADSEDYSFAVAPEAQHAYWMSTRNGDPDLLWYSASAMADPAPLDVKIRAGMQACPRRGGDSSPWVNLAGTILLFAAESVNDNCDLNDSGAYDLFAVPLDAAGAPASNAVAISSVNNTGGASNEVDPSLSQDACTLYFASDAGTGRYELYRARRN